MAAVDHRSPKLRGLKLIQCVAHGLASWVPPRVGRMALENDGGSMPKFREPVRQCSLLSQVVFWVGDDEQSDRPRASSLGSAKARIQQWHRRRDTYVRVPD